MHKRLQRIRRQAKARAGAAASGVVQPCDGDPAAQFAVQHTRSQPAAAGARPTVDSAEGAWRAGPAIGQRRNAGRCTAGDDSGVHPLASGPGRAPLLLPAPAGGSCRAPCTHQLNFAALAELWEPLGRRAGPGWAGGGGGSARPQQNGGACTGGGHQGLQGS